MDLKEVVSAYYSIYEGKKKEDEKPKKWFDDDGDGEGYEEGEVDGKFDKKKKKKKDDEEVDEGLEFVDDLTEEELDALVEETVEAYIEEGYDIDDLDQIFDEYLEEAKVTYGHDSGGDDKGDDLVSAVKKRKDEKAAKNQKRVEKVKNAIKGAVKKVKDAPGKAVSKVKSTVKDKVNDLKAKAHEPIVDYLHKPNKNREADRKEAGRGVFLGGQGRDGGQGKGTTPLQRPALDAKTKSPEGRKELRKVLKFDLKQRYRAAKLDSAKKQVKAYKKVSGKVRDLKDKGRAKVQSIKNAAARTSRKIGDKISKATDAPRKAVKAVRNKTAGALSALADKIKTEGIELDAFDTVTAYLIDEGFATTFDEAQKIMTTLDSELIKEVHEHQLNEAMLLTRADKVGKTPAWKNRDKKNVKTGEPIYKKADHLKNEDDE